MEIFFYFPVGRGLEGNFTDNQPCPALFHSLSQSGLKEHLQEIYARSDFSSTVSDAYAWSAAKRRYEDVKERIEAGETKRNGGALTLPEHPGKRITLMDGLESWQADLKEYGFNQGFTIE